MNQFRYVDLQTSTRPDVKQIQRAYLFVEPSDAQRVKAELALGLQQAAYESRDAKYIEPKGPLYGASPSILSSSAFKMEATNLSGQTFTLTFKVVERKKSTPKDQTQAKTPVYNIGSSLQVELMSDLPITSSSLGRTLSEFFRPFERTHFVHYRQGELEVLGQALGGIDPVFELHRKFDLTPNQALAALDGGTPLEKLVEELLARKGK